MSYNYKKSSVLFELQQAIKKKVAQKPKTKEQAQRNIQMSLDKRKSQGQRQSIDKQSSKQKQMMKTYKPDNTNTVSLINNENNTNGHSQFLTTNVSELKKNNHRKIDKLFSLINYALSSADKSLKYINVANFQAQFAIKLFKSDKQNLLNEMKNMNFQEISDISSNRDGSKMMILPNTVILQQQNLKLKKELSILEKQNERNRFFGQPSELELALVMRELQIQKFKECIKGMKNPQFVQRLSMIIEKQIKYESSLTKNHSNSVQLQSILKSLVAERNSLCKEIDTSKRFQQFEQIKALIQLRISPLGKRDDSHLRVLQRFLASIDQKVPSRKVNAEQHIVGEQEKINKIREQKYQLIQQIQTCKLKLGELVEISQLKNEIETISKQNKKALKKVKQMCIDLDNVQSLTLLNLIDALKNQIMQINNKNDQQITMLQNDKKEFIKQTALLRTQNKMYEQELQEKNQYINQLQSLIQNGNNHKIQTQQKQSNQYEEQIERLKEQMFDIQKECKGYKSLVQEAKETIKLLREQNQRMQQLVQQLQNKYQQAVNRQQGIGQQQQQVKSQVQKINKSLSDKLKQSNLELESLRQTINHNQQLYQQTISQINHQKQQNIEKHNTTIQQLMLQIKSLEGKSQEQLDKQKNCYLYQDQQADNENSHLRSILSQKQNQISNLKQIIKQLSQQQQPINQLQSKKLTQNDNIMNQQIIQLNNKLTICQSDKQKLQQQVNDIKQEISLRREQIIQRNGEIDNIKKINKQLANKLQILEQSQSQNNIQQINQKITQLQHINSKIENQYYNLKQQSQQLQAQITHFDKQKSNITTLLQANQNQILTLTKQLQNVNHQLNQAESKNKEYDCLLKQYHQNQKVQASQQQVQALMQQLDESINKVLELKNMLKQQKQTHQQTLKLSVEQFDRKEQYYLLQIDNLKNRVHQQNLKVRKGQQYLLQLKASLECREKQVFSKQRKASKKGKNHHTKQQHIGLNNVEPQKNASDLELQRIELQLQRMIEMKEKKQKIWQEELIELQQQLQKERKKAQQVEQLSKQMSIELKQKNKLITQLQAKLQSNRQSEKCQLQLLTNNQILINQIQQLKQQIQNNQHTVCNQCSQAKSKFQQLNKQFIKLNLVYEVNVSQLKQAKSKLDTMQQQINTKQSRLSQLTNKVQELHQSNKSLIQFKNVQTMIEKQYCNLIKPILKAIIDLDQLGDVDQMGVRTLLQIGSQKVIEQRIKARDQASKEKKNFKQQRQNQEDQEALLDHENDQLDIQSFQINSNVSPAIQEKVPTKINQPINKDKLQKEQENLNEGGQDFGDFNDFEGEINSSMISQDQVQQNKVDDHRLNHQPQYETSPKNQQQIKQQNLTQQNEEIQKQKSQEQEQVLGQKQEKEQKQRQQEQISQKQSIQDKQIKHNEQHESQKKNGKESQMQDLDDFNDYQSQKMNDSMLSNNQTQVQNNVNIANINNEDIGLGFDEFKDNNYSQLDSSLISNKEQHKQQPQEVQQQYQSQKQQIDNEQQKRENGSKEQQNEQIQDFGNFHEIGMNLSHIQQSQNHHNQSLEMDNFLDFQQNNLDQSMLSQKQPQQNDQNKQNDHNISDFNEFEDNKMSESMISQDLNQQKQVHQQKVEDKLSKNQDQVKEQTQYEKGKQEQENNEFDDFGDLTSQKLGQSMMSRTNEKNEQQDGNTSVNKADFEMFDDLKSEKMNESMVSEPQTR